MRSRAFCPQELKVVGVQRELLQGIAVNAIDAKGRVSLPVQYRNTIEFRSGIRQITLSLRFEPNHIRAFDEHYSKLVYNQITERFSPDQVAERARALQHEFGAVEPVPYEANGRVTLPELTRQAAGIDKFACFIAFADYFEIWNPEALLRSDRADPATVFHVKNQLKARGESL